MANEYGMSPKELKAQADAILAAADAAEAAASGDEGPAVKSARKSARKKAEESASGKPEDRSGKVGLKPEDAGDGSGAMPGGDK